MRLNVLLKTLNALTSRVAGAIVQDCPPELYACEVCGKLDCTSVEWLSCEQRLAAAQFMKSGDRQALTELKLLRIAGDRALSPELPVCPALEHAMSRAGKAKVRSGEGEVASSDLSLKGCQRTERGENVTFPRKRSAADVLPENINKQESQVFYPRIAKWIQKTLAEHSSAAKPVTSFGFKRLPQYYSARLLVASKVVVVPEVPMPPLAAMGLNQFSKFEQMDAGGITYFDTYFLRADQAHMESLHFHELVHVVQWELLGPEGFLALYADGLERFRYQDSPMEVMAYDLQDRFERDPRPFSVEAACRPLIRETRD